MLVSDVDIRINPEGLLKVSQLPASAGSGCIIQAALLGHGLALGQGYFGELSLVHGSQEQEKSNRMVTCIQLYPYEQQPSKFLPNSPWENDFSHEQIAAGQGGIAFH